MNLLRNFLVSIILLGISSSGISAGYSKSNTSTSSSTNATTHTGTTLASLGGNVNVNAENALTITGSQVLALAAQPKPDDNNTVGNPSVGNITLSGKTVLINEAHDTYSSTNAPKEVPLGDTSTSVGSTIQGNNVSITATGGDLTAIGANISATNNAAQYMCRRSHCI